ncbi:head GIN domain-containing protein [Cognatitamlana onchidii]|uniref:head GIN domain-containing protein n=1 Tax=Cognatitamlana onchidii TaxID=2562860 RepID=UPI0010A6059C|nr:head GIN domain-containing protein [Algibacter onchidii]
MKIVVYFGILFCAFVGFSQESMQRSVGEFKELKVYDLLNVELIKSDQNRAVASGDNASKVVFVNKNGKLKIKMDLDESYDGANTHVKLFYTTIDIIDANEGSSVITKEPIKQFEIELYAQEGATINVPVNVTYTTSKAVTGGIIEVEGQSKKQKISLFTGGKFKGENLESENAEVSINAAGEAYVNATKMVDIKMRAGGDVYIYGNPETVNESNVFGGRVKRMN